MKPQLVFVVRFACLLFFMAGTLALGVEIKTAVAGVKGGKIPRESVHQYDNAMPNLIYWQQSKSARYMGNLKPVIDGDYITGWSFSYKEETKPNPDIVRYHYSKLETPLLLPKGMGEDQFLKLVFEEKKRDFTLLLDEDFKIEPLLLNVIEKGEGSVVYGLWYTMRNPTERLRNGKVISNYRSDRVQMARTAGLEKPIEVDRLLKKSPVVLVAANPLPKQDAEVREVTVPFRIGGAREHLAVNVDESTVVAAPFRVQGEWLEWKAALQTDRSKPNYGKFYAMDVVNVTPGSPFDRAGMKRGHKIIAYQGIVAAGMDVGDFQEAISSKRMGNRLMVECLDNAGQHYRINVVVEMALAAVTP